MNPQPFILNPSESTPYICFDPEQDVFEMKGESRPENAKAFYDPVIDWVKNFCQTIREENNRSRILVFSFSFEYFSSASAKYLMNIFARLEELHKNSIPVEIRWIYNEIDIEMKESGEEFQKLLTLPVRFEVLRH
jgi:hypothetical protein